MTKKEQIIELAKKHIYVEQKKTQDGCYTGPGGFEELADEILALPLDVPGDDEIEEWAEDNYTGKIKLPEVIAFYSADWMRSEILKRNTP